MMILVEGCGHLLSSVLIIIGQRDPLPLRYVPVTVSILLCASCPAGSQRTGDLDKD